MSYVLGVDLGTTYTSAAISREGRTEIVQLGSHAASTPSVVVLREDGEVLTGDAAERRAMTEPDRTAREFKRRLGDPTPLILGGAPYGAEALAGILLKSVVEQVSAQEGEAPALVVVSHPASYGPYKLDLLRQAVRQSGLQSVEFLGEPQAAAIHYASQERVEEGAVIAVYDFGGGTFDAAVLRKTDEGFELLGDPEGLERLGGIDFDEAVLVHVNKAAGNPLAGLGQGDAASRAAIARLRDECRRGKEALSSDTDTLVPVLLPALQAEVRVTREEFEEMVRPRLRETIAALERTVRSAGLEMSDVDRIVLVGGTSRIPLVGATVRELTGRPIAVDSHPKHTIVLGAALYGARLLEEGVAVAAPVIVPTALPAQEVPGPVSVDASPAVRVTPATVADPSAWRPYAVPAAAVALVAILLAAFLLTRGGGDEDDRSSAEPDATGSPSAEASPSATATPPASPAAALPPPTATATVTPNPLPSSISAITLDGTRYQVSFATQGFQPVLPGQHVHFFFDTVTAAQAGVPGGGPWFVYGGASPFTGYGTADKPAAAQKMCILVANPNHSIQPGTGNCVDLPR